MHKNKFRNHLLANLSIEGAVATLLLGAFASSPLLAQSATGSADIDAEDTLADIVVTGTSIRGVPPTGSQLIQLGVEAITDTGATTTQELLANVPQLSSFNTAPRPDQRSNGILSTAPNIRGIGQAQTLVLINGHRLVGVGHLQNIPDPSVVPPSAIQRVEIVADGASSIYGSDGISGVVNVITRRDYEGLEAGFRVGFGADYNTLNVSGVTGHRWDGGGVMVAVEYSKTSRLEAKDRDFLTQDFSGVGGRDNRAIGNACTPATYRLLNSTGNPTGSFFQPATGAVDPRCTNYEDGDIYPKQQRLSIFSAGHQDVTDNIEVFFDSFYSKTKADAKRPEGSLYANAVMDRNNPFFPDFVPADVSQIYVYYNTNDLFGIPERDWQELEVYGGTAGVTVGLPRGFAWTTYVTGSHSRTDLHEGAFNPVANAALLVSSDPADAIDPFGGRTSDMTKITLADWEQRYFSTQYIWEVNTKADGTVATLPGGDLKVAVGGVYREEEFDGLFLNGRIGFNEGVGAEDGLRKVYSVFGELFIPLFGENNATSFMNKLNVSLSGRYDHYDDFGDTTNPKIGVNWGPVDGLTFRGTYSTSFHAPALADLYGPDTRAGYSVNGILPPGMPQGSVPGGIWIAGGNPDLKAETSRNYSFGVDLAPPSIPNLLASLTYYKVKFKGRVAFPSGSFFYVDPGFNPYFVDNIVCDSGSYPTGVNCVSKPIDPNVVYQLVKGLNTQGFPGPINSPADLPDIYSVSILRRANLAEIDTDGLDFEASYRFNAGPGTVGLSMNGNYVINYGQRAVAGSELVDQFPFGQARFKTRGQASYRVGPFTGVAMVNYSGSYHNQYSLADGTPATEKVGAFTTVDFHFGYQLPEQGVLAGTELSLDLRNTFDAKPPFMRSGYGYGVGDVIGRYASVAIRKKF